MPLSDNYDFDLEKQRAAERLRELGARAGYRQSPARQTGGRDCRINNKSSGPKPRADGGAGMLSGINLPFLSRAGADPDIMLILGLVLILSAESADKLLLLALLYILI